MRKIILFFLLLSFCALAKAQDEPIRYVKPTSKGGAYTNDGRSWDKAKDNIQDAINDLRSYMTQYNLHSGSVYVASGTYEPTEGVEGGSNGQLSTSFIVYDGIHVYGGFNVDSPEAKPDDRMLVSKDGQRKMKINDLAAGDTTLVRWQMEHETILSGNHNHNVSGSFKWNSNRKRYDTRFPGNSYHVVFFASNGFITDTDHPGYADSLKYEASIDGFTVQDGNASGATDVRQGRRDHTSMGGGVYMVKNSVVSNCIVQRCSAAMRGGGIYMDGGGEVMHSLIRECQSLGSGVSGGYGGGVCIDNNGAVRRSWITRNVARMGGGAAIISYPENHPRGGAATSYRMSDFDPYISATIVSNNTSTTEAGGVYLDRGGMINHVTVTRNENTGRDISYGRTRYGRSGGVYIYGAGQVYNSVLWGNKCDANNDIQYAATSGIAIPSYIRLQQPFIGYTALNNMDITDFTGSVRYDTYSFETSNNDPTRSGNFTLFLNPPTDAGAGVGEQNLRVWYPVAKTSLETKAVQLAADYSTQAFSVTSMASNDLFDAAFEPISTLGAIETAIEDIETASVAPVNAADADSAETIPTLYVDPDRIVTNTEAKSGASWDNPLDNISEAIEYFRQNTPENGKFQILVKQGTMTCAGKGAYYSPETGTQSAISLASVRMMPNLLLYGGFPSSLKGTNTNGRNPKDFPTRISGDIISSAYRYNTMHVVSFSVAHDAVLDGFQIYYGNARNSEGESAARGGGIVCGNQYYRPAERIDMTNNVVRNCVIANCSGPQGAAVFIGGSYSKADGTKVKGDLTMENCIINNNAGASSIIHASGDASITMDHCTVISNVGSSLLATSSVDGTEGKITVSNSAFHGNATKPLPSVNDLTAADIASLMAGTGITASNNLIDTLYNAEYAGYTKVFGYNASNPRSYANFVNPVRNIGVAENTEDNTVYGGNADYTPLDMNPVVNRGTKPAGSHASWGTDLTAQVTRDYGGAPDVGALECHQASASNDNGGQPTFGSVVYVRDYNTYDVDGNVLKADSDTTGRDGSSWASAINGNAVYSVDTVHHDYSRTSAIVVSTSVEAAENRYKLGLYHTGVNALRYAKANNDNIHFVNTATLSDGDDFIFLDAGNSRYYIYDCTEGKYVKYTDTNQGAGKIELTKDNSTNAKWTLQANTGNDAGTFGIVPETSSNPVRGWNYYGGVTNNLGLYSATDDNSKWRLWVKAPDDVRADRGLQYAVDQAAKTREASNKTIEVWASQGVYTNTSLDTVNSQYYGFRMAEGVNVFGGFPNYGNPSKNERDPKDYVTILQPSNEDPTATADTLVANSAKSVARVLVQPNDFKTETNWNGFTIRYGYLHSCYRYNIRNNIGNINTSKIGNAGGAGAYLMEKGVLENCEILKNVILVDPLQEGKNLFQVQETTNGGYHEAGAGVYITATDTVNGVGGTLKNCVIAYNELLHKFTRLQDGKHSNAESAWMYGAGLYQDMGIVYNTIIHDNHMRVIHGNINPEQSTSGANEVLIGAGAFLKKGSFYNNTIVHNTAESYGKNNHSIHVVIPGIYVYDNITMYNSVISDNTSTHDQSGTVHVFDIPVCAFSLSGSAITSIYSTQASRVKVLYSFINVVKNDNGGTYGIGRDLCSARDTFNTNIYLNNNQGTAVNPNYVSSQIYNDSTYRLVSGSPCINHGTEAIDGVTIPSYDAAYADRVQDCAIDIGAYEYNGAESITPREGEEDHYYFDDNSRRTKERVKFADYFVTQNGSGDASAKDPANAACAEKLQRVLDAAGRYKYDHPKTHVIVRLEALPDSAGYEPSRSAATNAAELTNPRSYSIIVPLGVELQGGWKTNSNFGIDNNGELHGRDPINNVTRLTGEYVSGTETVNVYHVVTFTDHVYDENGNMTTKLLSDSIDTYIPNYHVHAGNRDFDRAKLDGLYIEGGRATGTSEADRNGGAAVMTRFSHVSDCIIRDNRAAGYGGAFYMQPGAAIEGCILENNQAAYGGALAVAEAQTDSTTDISGWALILNNTIVGNNATTRGGGLWYNDNARTWNSVYWNNTSAEQNDISGITTTTDAQNIVNCPVNFCAVTNQTLAGNGNISLSPNNENGARWGSDTGLREKHKYDFFLPSRASVLTRAGMPYDVMHSLLRYLPGIDSVDIAGVARLEYTAADTTVCDSAYDGEKLAVKYNYNMEIGARAYNQGFSITIDPDHPLYRLYVAHPESMQANLANDMMESSDPYYRQQGSSFANPFLKLTDALNYVIDARKNYPAISRNYRFEIFIAEGTYMPFADMLGEQQNVRTRTFVIPEKVSLFGGIDANDSRNLYCQNTTDGQTVKVGDVTLIGASTDSIRLNRERYDLNQNSVVEPWEMSHATILSGFSEGSDLTVKNVYHVITSIADSTIVGQEPDMYSDAAGKVTTTDRHKETQTSRGARAIILDGLTITEGAATNYEGTSVRNHNFYFRGGGIFITGFPLQQQNTTGISDMRQGARDVPLIVSNMLFQNNQARQGGAIYTDGLLHVIGSSFVQNLAVSPSQSETDDRNYVTFSGGGAIATNDTLWATNTIFANNEARDGGGEITLTGVENKPSCSSSNGMNANDIRAYGGVIWAGDSAAVRFINCNSVRNKAKAFASIYNCTPNTNRDGTGHPHFGVNCVFWGNQVEAGQDSSLINYGNTSNRIGALYFSAYQRGKGVEPTVNDSITNRTFQGRFIEDYSQIMSLDDILGHANHNVIINDDNDAVDGPNFTLPSNQAGIDGYMSSADWVPSRVNSLTDTGWGMIKQDSVGNFLKTNDNPDFRDDEEYRDKETFLVNGIYGWLSDFYRREYGFTLLPLGDEKYMSYADASGYEGTMNMDRISSDPLGTDTVDYIDIGVYEYKHTMLHIADGDEVDELWVSDSETAGNNDGRSFDRPTSDLQRAIQTLLLSRNNHPKIIHVMEGTYSPIYEQDNGDIGFVVQTAPNNTYVSLRDSIIAGQEYQATSLTILGGYSKDIEGLRDVSKYPTVLKMNRRDFASDANTAHLLYIVSAEQWGTIGNVRGQEEASESGDNSTIDTRTNAISKTAQSHGLALPIVLDGLTFENTFANDGHKDLTEDGSSVNVGDPKAVGTGGSAIYYREQFQSSTLNVTDQSTPSKSTIHLKPTATAPKLTIRNCKFDNNGLSAKVPTVYIGKGGGKTIIYNSLFNDNAGNPVESMDSVDIVNCTFAKNGGHIYMRSDDAKKASTLTNSLIWRNDTAHAFATPYEGFTSDSVRFNAAYNLPAADRAEANHNDTLSYTNALPMLGPNFVNVTTSRGVALDYSLNPGMITMNTADTTLYKRMIAVLREGVADESGRIVLNPDTTWKYDLSWGERLYNENLDRGAYECRVQQQRVLYVIPTKTTGTMTGTSWENAYGQGQLQTAIDAAAIYASTHQENNRKKMSYVLVKGENNNTATENVAYLRDGVSVYGSIPDNYLASITEEMAEDSGRLMSYIDSAISVRPGIASRSTHRSRVLGVRAQDDDYKNGALFDGFEVRSAASLARAAVIIEKPVVLSKLIIDNNTISGAGYPAINMNQGLMYNCLVYENKPSTGQPVVSLGKQAAIVNSTIVSNEEGVTAVKGEGFVANSVTYGFNAHELSGDVSREGNLTVDSVNTVSGIPFAPYLTPGVNPYRLSSYITSYQPYRYQLNESSFDIAGGDSLVNILKVAPKADAGETSSPYDIINDAKTNGWIDFDKDCDLLGNNRRLGHLIDRGCFETWNIRQGDDITASRTQYPHEGSVVYIMDNANLSLGESTSEPVFTNDNPFRPAFLLIRPGASLYGNGSVIQLQYVASEAVVPKGEKRAIISLPFRYRVGDLLVTSIESNNQIHANHLQIEAAQTYNGRKRAEWNYHFSEDDSKCWETMDTTQIMPANTGWMATLPDSLIEDRSVTLRLVGYGLSDGDYVYTENGQPKTVMLTQYDNRDASDGTAHFTKAENMGWNILGLPYLVSRYSLGASTESSTDYAMNVPHVLYRLNDDGRFVTSQSWNHDTLSIGQGVMTQTAVSGNTESVTFALPVKASADEEQTNARQALMLSSGDDDVEDVLQLNASETAKSLQYTLGSDGVKWLPLVEGKPSMYALTSEGTPLSLSSATPLETDIPVVVTGRLNGESTISIEDTAAFNGVSHVWLRDDATGKVVDLKEEALHIYVDGNDSIPSAGSTRNLTLRLGGVKMDGANGAGSGKVNIYVRGHILHVDGVAAGDRVDIYTISGQLYRRAVASDTSFTYELVPGVYVVRAKGNGRAVSVRY